MNVSVIIPVYNAEKYIRRAVLSVLDQEEVKELLIVDDGSQDNSQEICLQLAAIDKRITLLQHPDKKNRGVSASRNLGIKRATNEFIAFLDADDYYLPNRFKQTALSFTMDKTIDGIYEEIGIHNEPENLTSFSIPQNIAPESLFESLSPIGSTGWFSANGLTVRKSIFQKTGFFDEGLKTSEDTLLWLKMAAIAKLVAGNIEQAVAITERIEQSLSSDKIRVDKDQLRMLYKLYFWVNKADLSYKKEKKELILDSIIEKTTGVHIPKIRKYLNMATIFYCIGINDGLYMVQSKRIRRLVSNIIMYNKKH